jgi:penicillin-binding protein 1C
MVADGLRSRLLRWRRWHVRDAAPSWWMRARRLRAGSARAASVSRVAGVDAPHAPRQAGSTLTPFLYALAARTTLLLTAASVLDDSPVDLGHRVGLYVPQNDDRSFRGPLSVRSLSAIR